MSAVSRLLAAQHRYSRTDDGPLLVWQARREILQRVSAQGEGLPPQAAVLPTRFPE